MWNGVCPLCQSRKIYAQRRALKTQDGLYYYDLRLIGGEYLGREALALVTYICVRCGYVAVTVADEGLEGLEEKLLKWGWTAIEEVHPDGTLGPQTE
jgi:hypothetical protein